VDIVFAVLPFADVDRPSIGVSLLQSICERAGFSSKIVYGNFDLAETIGVELYTRVSEGLPSESLVGDWFFADLLFGGGLPAADEYIARILSRFAQAALIQEILEARKRRGECIARCVERIRSLHPRVVGFTTTFHQTCVSVAIARELKSGPDPPVVIFGGANCEGEMGLQLLKSFPEIDYVCTREGDVALPLLLRRVLREGDAAGVQGILKQGATALSTPDMVRDLNALPLPDYDDYFARLETSPLKSKLRPELPVETSRGCWWGAKHHCTFCGLNGDTMEFRSKTPARAFEEMKALHDRYGVKRVSCVDNILDLRLVPVLFPMLRKSGLDLELFYEIKANLKQEQVAMLRSGGVTCVQPGIESFSNQVLKLMEKGCTGWQNVQLLRWCEEVGMMPAWNLLSGFPGEDPAEYAKMAELIPKLVHLQPPASCAPVRLDRFSPFFTRAAQFGLQRLRPSPAYYYVYPFGRRELAKLAYFFDFDYPDGRKPHEYVAGVKQAIDGWYKVRRAAQIKPDGYPPTNCPVLTATVVDEDHVVVSDTRPCATAEQHTLVGLNARILLLCDVAQTVEGLARKLGTDFADTRAGLSSLSAANLVAEMDGHFGSLPLFANRPLASRETREAHADTAQVPETAAAQPLLRLM
jgi:ribosomal peptide maturation radical SAM protein 1